MLNDPHLPSRLTLAKLNRAHEGMGVGREAWREFIASFGDIIN